MTPDEALSIVDTKAAGRTRFAEMEPYADEVLAAEVRRLRAMFPDQTWHGCSGYVMYWEFGGTVIHDNDGSIWWHMDDEPETQCETVLEATRQLLECAQSKCQKP